MAVSSSSLRESATFETGAPPCAPAPTSTNPKSQIDLLDTAAVISLRTAAQQDFESRQPANVSDLRSSAQHPGYACVAAKNEDRDLVRKPPTSAFNDEAIFESKSSKCCSVLFRVLSCSWKSRSDATTIQKFSGNDELPDNDECSSHQHKSSRQDINIINKSVSSTEPVNAMELGVPFDEVNDVSRLGGFPHPRDLEKAQGSCPLRASSDTSLAAPETISGFATLASDMSADPHLKAPCVSKTTENSLNYSSFADPPAVVDTAFVPIKNAHSSNTFTDRSCVQAEAEKSSPLTSTTHSTSDDPSTVLSNDAKDSTWTTQSSDLRANVEETLECSLVKSTDALTEAENEPPVETTDEHAVGVEELERTVDMIMWQLRQATPPELRHKVFIEQCRAWHPDKNCEDLRKATIAFQRLQSTRGWFLAKDGEYVRQPDDPDLL